MSTTELIIELAFAALASAAVVLAALRYIHMLQLESYQGRMYLKWVFKRFGAEVLPFIFIGLISLILRACYVLFNVDYYQLANYCRIGADVVYLIMLVLMFATGKKHKAKKPLVFTGRVVRLMVALFIVAFIFTERFFVTVVYFNHITWAQYMWPFILRYLPGMLLPLFLLLAYALTYPIEELNKSRYFNDAKKKLAARTDVYKIGITGSYGKTSTKHFLAAILGAKFNVLYTPGSYNTPMGVTRTIREQLAPEHNVFIAEMGARYRGDIKELCRLVAPDCGIITAVGKQHLDTFGSLDRVIDTKAELIEALPENGKCFFNADNEFCVDMYEECALKDKYLFGTEGPGLYLCIEDVSTDSSGSSFTLKGLDGRSVKCTTMLLGRHNINNLAGAAACAMSMGMTLDEIAAAIKEIPPVEHRLQLIPGAVTVIDDAFNSNPAGSAEALETLARFPGRHIVVTPGMVELGEEEEGFNRAFGRQMAACADIAILVGGKHADPIEEGLLEAGFDSGCIVRAATLDEASEKLPLYTQPGCVVLFENDLPDNYN